MLMGLCHMACDKRQRHIRKSLYRILLMELISSIPKADGIALRKPYKMWLAWSGQLFAVWFVLLVLPSRVVGALVIYCYVTTRCWAVICIICLQDVTRSAAGIDQCGSPDRIISFKNRSPDLPSLTLGRAVVVERCIHQYEPILQIPVWHCTSLHLYILKEFFLGNILYSRYLHFFFFSDPYRYCLHLLWLTGNTLKGYVSPSNDSITFSLNFLASTSSK